MRKSDKKKNMERVNKIFQERNNPEKKPKPEVTDNYTYTKDMFPELSKILK